MGTGSSKDEAPASQSQPMAATGAHASESYESRGKTAEKLTEEKPDHDFKAKAVEKLILEAKPSETKSMLAQNKAAEMILPHNYESILRDADSPIDKSSMDKIYDQLCTGVFLDQKRKKYWIDKKTNSNCFMLYARDLSITWAEEKCYWNWTSLRETSDTFIDVAELLNVCWLEIHGKFEISKLSPGVLYQVAVVIMRKARANGWQVPVNVRLILPDRNKQEHKENVMEKPEGQWIEIPVGEFKTSTDKVGETEISMYEYEGGVWKSGIIVKGIVIRPKN